MHDIIDILLVDDEQRNLDALEAILEDPGYRLLRSDNADRALRLLLDHEVAAIVLDIKMPGVSGLELAQLIKGTKKFREVPILFLTAYMVDDQDVLTGYGAGAVDYLTKPVKPQILRHKIAVFAELFRKTRALAELNKTLEARVQERTAELERSEAALRAASDQKDAFIAMLAHELRNPLAPLRTGIDLLLQLPAVDPVVARALPAMNRQLHHMVRLIDDLLDVSRVSRGMLELKREIVDLVTAIEMAVEIVRPFFDQRSQAVRVDAAVPVHAWIDPTRVAQIVGNLLHNASKYSPHGGLVRVELVVDSGEAIVRVVDAGAGIPLDQLSRIFDMFARIERSVPNANGGLGIGLALAQQLASMHGGKLSATSRGEGHGATFTLTLPIAAVAPGATEPRPGAGHDRGHAGAIARLTIVIIEDNHDAADMLAMWLETLGHDVQIARTGADGLVLVREVQPDVVLCDIGLPDMDGIEVCRRIKTLELRTRPVMVALTGWGMDADHQRTSEAGFAHHLVKPVSMDTLREILRRAQAS